MVLTVLALLGLVLLGSLIYPFASALLFAAVLAGGLYPSFKKLTKKLGERPLIASGVITLGVGLLLSAPALWLTLKIGNEVLSGASAVQKALRNGGGVPELIRLLPRPIQAKVRKTVQSVPGGAEGIEDLAVSGTEGAAAAVTTGLAVTTSIIINFALMLVALFFLLVDGKALVRWTATVAPLPEDQIYEILDGFRDISVAVIFSSLSTAGVQTAAALIGYVVAGVPEPLFFAFVTFVVAFIPAVGASVVVIALAGYLFFIGQNQAAFGLALWGVLVVSTIDNLVRPWLLKDRMQINSGLIFFALVGGISTFGPIGLIAGPLILSFFLAVVRLSSREPSGETA